MSGGEQYADKAQVGRDLHVGDTATITGTVRRVESIAPFGHLRVTLDYDDLADDTYMVTQTILATPELNARGVYGNCIQAAVASLLGWPLDAVPHFGAFRDWEAALRLWAEGESFVCRRHDSLPPLPSLAPLGRCLYVGDSPRGFTHVVVGQNGKVVWDPHPSRAGLTSLSAVFELYRLSDVSSTPGSPNSPTATQEAPDDH